MNKDEPNTEYTDLRSICRRANTCRTVVAFQMLGCKKNWLILGETQIRRASSPSNLSHDALLQAYLGKGATDPEEDSAYALRLPLQGVTFQSVDYHVTYLTATIAADPDNFRVPRPGYDPAHMKGSSECTVCKKAHRIVPSGFYVPPFDPELYEQVRGLRVEIMIGGAKEE